MSSSPAPQSLSSSAKRKRKGRLKLWLVLGGVALVGVLAVVAAKMKGGSEVATAVTVDKAVIKTITQVVTATGKVQPEVEVRISSEVAGELVDIPVKEGQTVQKGDILCKIKPDLYQAVVAQQEASLVAARAAANLSRARLAKAKQDLVQAEQLYAKQLISDSELLSAQTAADVAKAELESSLAQISRSEGSLDQAKDQLNKTVVYAPMEGTISSLTSKVGERVLGTGQFAGTETMRLADLRNMEVRVKVNENDIVNVKLGDNTLVAIDAFPDRKFVGKVYEISNSAISLGAVGSNAALQAASASDEVTNFLVKIRITDSASAFLRPGMSATVDIETKTVENVVAIPIQSVTVRDASGKSTDDLREQKTKEAKEKSGNDLELAQEKADAKRERSKLKRVVFVKEGDVVKQREVTTGIADNTVIEVQSGLKEGEVIVTGSYAVISRKLKDGMKVRIEKAKSEEKK